MRKVRIGLAAALLAVVCCAPPALAAPAKDAARSETVPAEPCGLESDIAPQSAIRDRYQGADAAAFLLGVGAIDESAPLPRNLTAIVLSGDEVFGGNAAFIAVGACVRGSPLFLDPVRYRLGRATVARRRAGLPIALAPLSALAAKGDAEAQLLAGSRREAALPGAGRGLLERAARQGQALAMLELGYLVAGLNVAPFAVGDAVPREPAPDPLADAVVPVGPEVPPVRFQSVVPAMDRAAGYCWLKAAVAGGDGGLAELGTIWLGELTGRMTLPERDAARALWASSANADPADMCRAAG